MTDRDASSSSATAPTRSRALNRDQRVDEIAKLAEALRALGVPHRFHGKLMLGALRDGNSNAITWPLIHVLEGLEKSVL